MPSETTGVAPSGADEFDPFAGPAILATAPSTQPQRELWTASRLGTDASLAFNESISLELRGPLDLAALQGALDDLVSRHEALRSTFSADGTQLMVGAPFSLAPQLQDWSGRTEAEREAAWRALLADEVERPFDLERGPLVRAQLVRLAPELHRATLTAHHIVCDGWSTGVLVKEWAALYGGRRAGQPAALGKAESLSAYALEQSRAATSVADESYWVKRFAGEIPVLELPGDRPRPPLKTYAARREDFVLDAELVTALKRAGARERASLFTTLLAGFHALLHRLSSQEDLVVGIPFAGQSVGGHESLVGHCVNTLAIRAAVSSELPFRSLLGEVRTAMLDAAEHAGFTLGRLLQALPIPRDPSRLPLVSVCFNLDRGLGAKDLAFAGLETSLSTNARHFENFDLFVNAVELDGRVTLEVQYNTDLFEPQTVRRWLDGYALLLQGIAADVGATIGALPLVTPAQKAQLDAWNAETIAPREPGLCVHGLIEAQAARTPDAVAVEFEGEKLTYGALNSRANQLARALQKRGVGPGSLVGLCVERSPRMFVGLLGILKAGAAYVPLDPGYPRERLAFMVEDARMPVLVTEARAAEELQLQAPHVLRLDADAAELEALDASNLAVDAAALAERPAYVIYTSGSTGKPKGVLVPHRAVVNLLLSVQKRPGMAPTDVVLAVTTLSFDIAVSEVILPLTVGAKVVLASREVASDGTRLLALLRESKTTWVDATPATYRLLLAAGWTGGEGLKVICTGEALPRDLAEALVARCASVWNGYGPTETCVWSTFAEVRAPVGRIRIGRPVDNTTAHVLDARRQPVPIGVPGELFIGGSGVSLGYLNRPELTAERFIADPFSSTPGAKLYRTGDLVRYLPDGELECLGRNDHQVKLRGFRIELGEIESALALHPGVRAAAVIVREDRPGDKRLVGYVQLRESANPSDAELRAHLGQTLPDYMVPQHLVRLPQLPLTPSGKIDRKALPAPQLGSEGVSAEFVAPRNPIEEMLAELWREVLGVGRVSIHDNFFHLGGHSLLASQVLARLRRDYGVNLSFRKMFEAPTIAKFAALLDGATPNAAPAAAASITRRSSSAPVPLSLMQERLWLLEEMDPTQKLIHQLPAAWRLRGPVDPALLEESLNLLIARHETLRTTLAVEPGGAVQRVADSYRLTLGREDLRGVPTAEREKAMQARLDEETRVPFDLAKLPLFRATLFTLADDEHALYTVRHNLIWDGWSFDIFLRELCAVYTALASGKKPELKPLPIAYRDFTAWHRGWLQGPEHQRQVDYWRKQLDGAGAPLELPADRPRPASASHAGHNVGIWLTPAEHQALTALGREAGATLFTVAFAAFNVLLHRHSGQDDLLVGTPVRARTQPETEELIGPFINAVVVRTRVDPKRSFRELLAQVRETTLDAFSNQEMPLESLGSKPPIVRAFFSLQDARNRPPAMGAASIEQLHVLPPAAANDLMLWMMETQRGLLAMLNFSTDLFDAASMERFLERLRTLLAAVLQNPDRPIGELAVLPEAERAQIAGFAAETVATPALVAFASRVQEQPEAIALRDGTNGVSYAELENRAKRLAAFMRAAGAIEGARVAVHVASPVERTIATLATLGCAAVLVPFDATQSPELLAARWNAEKAALLVTDGERSWAAGARTVHLRSQSAEIAGAPADAWTQPGPDAVALRIAGAETRFAQLDALVSGAARVLELKPADVALTTAPTEHPEALIELLAPLTAGARVAFGDLASSGAVLAESLTAAGATVFAAPPAAWLGLVDAGWKAAGAFKAIVVGDAPDESLVTALRERGARVFEAHGAPEVAGWYTLGELPGALRALPGLALQILDPRGTPAPLGVPGTVHVAGIRTEERGRWRPDGSLELLGRADGRVRIGRSVIATSEIEAALKGFPAVAQAAITIRGRRSAEKRLVAYVAARPGHAFTESELRTHVRQALPALGIRPVFVEVDSIPLKGDGTIDWAKLPPAPGEEAPVDRYVAPRTEPERRLAKLWQEVLGVERVGRRDNFFDLGGHSLLALQVVGRVERELGTRMSPRVLLLNTLEQAAALLPQAPAAPVTTPAAAEVPLTQRLFDRLKKRLQGP